MKKIFGFALLTALALTSCTQSNTDAVQEEEKVEVRIVSLAGTVTEVVYLLEEEASLVAVDVTSTYPEQASEKENLGHASQMTAESIISQNPTHVIGFKEEVNPELAAQLKAASIEVVLLEKELSVDGTAKVIKDVAAIFGKEEKGAELVKGLKADLSALKKLDPKPSVLFIYARGAKMMMVAGTDTPLDKMITLAGAKNAAGMIEGFKPLTAEAVINANPDLVLLFESGVESLEGEAGVLQIPGLAKTNAGLNKNILSMDGQYLSGFGPRLGKALTELNAKLATVVVKK